MRRTVLCVLIAAIVNLSASAEALGQTKFDQEVEHAVSSRHIQHLFSRYAQTSNTRAMELYKEGTYLCNVLGKKDKAQRMTEGIRRLKEALKLDPNFAAAHVSLGHAYWNSSVLRLYKGRDLKSPQRTAFMEKAKAEYKRAIELDPGNAEPYFRLGLATHDVSERIGYFKKVLDLDPQYNVPMEARAHIAESEGRIQEAFDYLIQRMARIKPAQRCSRVKNYRPKDYGFGYFLQKYPKEYEAFIERVCAGRDLPPYSRPSGGA